MGSTIQKVFYPDFMRARPDRIVLCDVGPLAGKKSESALGALRQDYRVLRLEGSPESQMTSWSGKSHTSLRDVP